MRIILVRHGKTENNKSKTERELTPSGIKGLQESAKKIKKNINPDKSVLVCTPTIRAIQSAIVMSNVLNIPISPKFYLLSVGDIRLLKESLSKAGKKEVTDEALLKNYWEQFDSKKLSKELISPLKIVKLFYKALKEHSKFQTVIFIGHSGSLDTLLKYQGKFKPLKPLPTRLLKYAEFIELS